MCKIHRCMHAYAPAALLLQFYICTVVNVHSPVAVAVGKGSAVRLDYWTAGWVALIICSWLVVSYLWPLQIRGHRLQVICHLYLGM